ncbi:MAG: ArsR/SmtB family transcription factor [Acidimicrobiales bacterium]
MDQFTALADPTRRSIVEMLAEGERSAGELAGRFSISQPAVSRHLRVLRESGLVVVRPVAQLRIYSLEADRLDELGQWVARTKAVWAERFDRIGEEIRRARLAGSSSVSDTADDERGDGS